MRSGSPRPTSSAVTHDEPLGSMPHPSHMRAISYATRVMTSDPNSILVDGGERTSELVANLAFELVNNMRLDAGFTLREPKVRLTKKIASVASIASRATSSAYGDPKAPVSAIVKMDTGLGETKTVIVSNLTRALNKGAVKAGRRTSMAAAALASPLFGTFRTRGASAQSIDGLPNQPSTNQTVKATAPPSNGPVAPAPPKAGTVELESIIPAQSKPPTLYLSRNYTSLLLNPAFKPADFAVSHMPASRFSIHLQEGSRQELHTDRFGFLYDIIPYDVKILVRARDVGCTAPACLTGVRIADRGEGGEADDEDEWPDNEGIVTPSKKADLEVVSGLCNCIDGVRPKRAPEILAREQSQGDQPMDSPQEIEPSTIGDPPQAISGLSEDSSKEVRKKVPTATSLGGRGHSTSNSVHSPASREVQTGDFQPDHVCNNTVRFLLSQLVAVHDRKQKERKTEWDTFIRQIRKAKVSTTNKAVTAANMVSQASSGAAALLGLAKGTEDEEVPWTEGLGLIGVAQMGLEWKEFFRLVQSGIPLAYRAKVWFECSGAHDLSEPGVFQEQAAAAKRLREGSEKSVAIEEIEKDVTRTMPLNVFFGGDGQGVDKLRAVLGAYSLWVYDALWWLRNADIALG
jgi:small G protein signaling modulator 3